MTQTFHLQKCTLVIMIQTALLICIIITLVDLSQMWGAAQSAEQQPAAEKTGGLLGGSGPVRAGAGRGQLHSDWTQLFTKELVLGDLKREGKVSSSFQQASLQRKT